MWAVSISLISRQVSASEERRHLHKSEREKPQKVIGSAILEPRERISPPHSTATSTLIEQRWCYKEEGATAWRRQGTRDREHLQSKKISDRTSRQTQAGIGHSAPAHRCGQVQNRIMRRLVRWGKIEHSSEAEQPRTDGRPGRQGKACQHRRVRGLAGAHRSRHPKKERCNKIQTP